MNVDPAAPVHLVKGGDEVLVGDAVSELVRTLVGDGDRSLMVEELTIDAHVLPDDTGYDIAPIVDAAQTPPFLTDRRVVVVRHAGVFSTKDAVAQLTSNVQEAYDPKVLEALLTAHRECWLYNPQERLKVS